MNSYRGLGIGNSRLIAGIITLAIAICAGGVAQAGTQYTLGCEFCHHMPPLDSATGTRDAVTGATKGNHGGHAGADAASCAKCHGAGVLSYNTQHRDKKIELDSNINGSPALGHYSRGFANQSSVPPNPLGSCSNVNCHFESGTPSWGSPELTAPGDCTLCHGAAPATGNHPVAGSKHGSYYGTGTGSCSKCHPDHAGAARPFSHATSAASRGISVSFSSAPNSGGSYSGDGLNFLPSQHKASFGSCSSLYCHSNGAGGAPNVAPTWGASLDCTGCHNATAASGKPMTSAKHGAHVNNASFLGSNFGCVECHAATVAGDGTIADTKRHVKGFVDFSGARSGKSYNAGTGVCSTVLCHSDGKGRFKDLSVSNWKSSATLDCKGCHGADAAPAFASVAGEPNYGNGGPGAHRANTHQQHTKGNASSCDACHTGTTNNGTSIKAGSTLHLNGSVDVSFNAAKAGSGVTWNPASKTCSNIQCHGTGSGDAQWGSTACLGCHSVRQNNRAAVGGQFGANSHHIQGAVSDDKCYQCHWEANSDGSINTAYHGGAAAPGAPVQLVVYGAGVRPSAYSLTGSATAVQYTANGSRSEIQKINTHCLGCHSDQNNGTTPFADGKTPKQYAWDGTSVAARYAQTGVTTWGKYSSVGNAAQKRIAKAYSAHGNAGANKRGWNTATGVDGAIANTGGAVNVQCYDCHNSHGSTVAGTTTRYASATVNGGILKDTASGLGGYSIAYKPYSGGSAALKNKRNAGASLCLDCHMNATAATTPWGYNSTYGATQPVLGYWDAPMYGSYSTSGAEQRYPFKRANGTMGGHFGASMAMTTTPSGTIGGLCTPCHDPHGVSPSLGANQQYAVPLLKGTWVTSPYKEDTAPLNNVPGTNRTDLGLEGVAYHIDQNTFSAGVMTQTVQQSAGLCLGCHSQTSLTNGATHTWKSKDRIHEAVAGWKTANGTKQHNYSCSKCHAAHTSSMLPRLMVTNCLDGRHKGRMGYNAGAATTGYGSGDEHGCYGMAATSGTTCTTTQAYLFASGSGRIPGNYWGGDSSNNQMACHETDTGNGTDQSWNVVTPWADLTPTVTSGPAAVLGGLRVLLNMDEASWNGTANEVKDSSGGGNNGTAYNATTVAGGVSGSAGNFTVNSSVQINYATGSTPVDNFTMEAWIKPTTTHEIDAEATSGVAGTSGQNYLFKPDQMGSNGGAGVSVGTNGISVYEHGDNYLPPLAVYQGAISSTQWSHLAVVYENKRPSIYLNGVLVRTGLQSLRPHVYASQKIGAGDYGYYTGLADKVAIYERNLSAADIQLHAQQLCPVVSANVEATINWSTVINATSYVDYGLTSSYGSTLGSAALTMNHSITLPNLVNHSTYHYRVRSQEAGGRQITSGDLTFTMESCIIAEPPSAPTGVAAAAGDGQVLLSWTNGAGATSAQVRYGTATGSYGVPIDAASPLTITGLVNGSAIYYQVGSENAAGTTWSPEAVVTPVPPMPTAPTGISALAASQQLTFTWTPGTGVGVTSVLRYGLASGSYGTPLDVVSPKVLYPLTNGSTIYYQIGAKNLAGTTWSDEYTATPALVPGVPTSIAAVPGNGQAVISWTAGTNATSSLIRYGTATGVYGPATDLVKSPLTLTGLANDMPLYFQVGSKNLSQIAWSSEYTVTPSSAAPSAATQISAVPGYNQATLSWTAGANATSSLIRYGTATGVYPNSISSATSPRILTGLANGATTYYQIGAQNGSGTTWSGEFTVVPAASAPSIATGISALAGNGQATITWTAGTNATSSLIWYGTASAVYTGAKDPAISAQTLTGLSNGGSVYYRVGARNASGITWSAEYSVVPQAGAPAAATAISATPGNGQATISWTAATGTTSLVRYGTVKGIYGPSVDPSTSPKNIQGLANGATVYYQVGVRNSYGTTWSDENSVVPTASAPLAASSVAATPGNAQATISWTAGSDATSSLLRYGIATGVYPTNISSATSPRTITGLTNGSTVYYQVGTQNGSGTTWSAETSVVPTASAPTAATGISAAVGNTQVTITFSAGAGSTSSSIRYGTTSGVNTSTIPATSPSTITGLVNAVPIYYQVGAVNGSGTTWSTEYSAVPSEFPIPGAPTGISAVQGNGQVTISWTAGTYAARSLIRYGTGTGVYPTTIDPAVSAQTITGLANGTTIYYQVGAINGAGTTWSAENSVYPNGSAPQAATAITASTGTSQITVSWVAGGNSTTSSLRYGMAPGVYTSTITGAVSPATISGLTNLTRIYYEIGANNASGTTWSAETSATTGAPAIPAPDLTSYTNGGNYYYYYYYSDCANTTPVTLNWSPVTSPDGDPVEYKVQLNGVDQAWQSGTSFTFAAVPTGSYWWSVKARDAVHTVAESAISSQTLYIWDANCQKSSCPLVYSWNGTKFNYETDLQGPAISQIWKPGRYVNLYQPSYIVLDSLVADANQQYPVNIWESLPEATLIDEAKLLAIDYPAGYQIVSSGAENTYYYGYTDPFKVYTIKDPVLPKSATDKYGNDVLAAVLAVDDNPVTIAPDDPDNFFTFDFGTIQHPENAKLVIDGWQDINSKIYLSSLTIQPYLEVVDANGAWVKVKSFGMPMGDLKTMVVDMSNLFLSSDQRVRVHLGIKKAQVWVFDRIRMDDSAPVSVTVQELAPAAADLEFAGSSITAIPTLRHRLAAGDVGLPINPDYGGYGNFTRYGDVLPLLTQRDDKYMIMNYADRLDMKFPAPAAPQTGMIRGFVLKVDNYYKDFKNYKYLEPLPFHGMSDYPPPSPQAFPTDADHMQYLYEYNTRSIPGPATPVLTPQPSPVQAVDGGAALTLQWGGVTSPGGNAVQYLVEVSSAANMSAPSYQSTWQAGTSWSQTLPAGTWYWRVTARDSVQTAMIFTSATGSFSIVAPAP